MAKVKLGILVSGRGTNLQAILDATRAGALDADVTLVVSNQPDVRALERGDNRRVRNHVSIRFGPGAESCMKPGRHVVDLRHAYVRWKAGIQAALQDAGRMREDDLGTRNLAERVNARIGSAGAMHSYRGTLEACQCLLE